jgi:hypothetical protein
MLIPIYVCCDTDFCDIKMSSDNEKEIESEPKCENEEEDNESEDLNALDVRVRCPWIFDQKGGLIRYVSKLRDGTGWLREDNFEFTKESEYDPKFDEYDQQFDKVHDYEFMQLIDVIIGNKTMCMIENDYYVDFDDSADLSGDMSIFQRRFFVEFFSLKNCGLLRFIFDRDDDPTCLYFYEENWINALIMYLFNERKYDHLFKDVNFEVFTGILLGYSVTSCINYSTLSDLSDYQVYNDKYYNTIFPFTKEKFEKKKELFLSKKDDITKAYNHAEKVISSLKKQILDLTEKGNYTYYNMICGKQHPNQLIDIDLKIDLDVD